MDDDLLLINDLNQCILMNPRAVHPLRLLVQIYSRQGMVREAVETARNLIELDMDGLDANTYNTLSSDVQAGIGRLRRRRDSGQSPHSFFGQFRSTSSRSGDSQTLHSTPNPRIGYFSGYETPSHMGGFHLGFGTSFRNRDYPRKDWDIYQQDTRSYPSPRNTFQRRREDSGDSHRAREKPAETVRLPPIQAVADRMASEPSKSLDTAIQDLISLITTSRKQDPPPSDDNLRSSCVARTKDLASVLHPKYNHLAQQALMHIDHEQLKHTYVNDETMVSVEPISTIPRDRFFVSEDNYAWDMAELVDALKANPAAAFRNPLSRAPFTEADVTAIVRHPLGRGLGAMQVQQSELRQGVRKETVDKMAALASVLLEDEDSMEESREAMDDFAAYTATLPRQEKDALDALRVPAIDRHTGWGYDASLGEMLRDAKGNQVCLYTLELEFLQGSACRGADLVFFGRYVDTK